MIVAMAQTKKAAPLRNHHVHHICSVVALAINAFPTTLCVTMISIALTAPMNSTAKYPNARKPSFSVKTIVASALNG